MAERKQAAGRSPCFFERPVVAGSRGTAGEADWIDGSAAGPTQL